MPIESTLEIKTRVFHKPINVQDVLPQLWVSQTPNLVRAYHRNGLFKRPEVEDITLESKRWEQDHQEDLKRLAELIKRIIDAVRESRGNGVVKYDDQDDKLMVWKTDGRKMLPDDLYSKLDNKHGGKTEANESSNPAIGSRLPKTTLRIGNALYDVDLSMIPYLSSFVRFQRNVKPHASEFAHNAIPLFDTALKGLELGYRHCFRSLPADISQYHILRETYDFLGIDVIGGQSVDNIFAELKACKTSYELDYKHYRAVKGNKKYNSIMSTKYRELGEWAKMSPTRIYIHVHVLAELVD